MFHTPGFAMRIPKGLSLDRRTVRFYDVDVIVQTKWGRKNYVNQKSITQEGRLCSRVVQESIRGRSWQS